MSSTICRKAASSRLRGCGNVTSISPATRPGFEEKIRMRSHMKTASSMLWVTSSIALVGSRRSIQRSRRSVRIVSAVNTSSAEKGLVQQQNGRLDDECPGKADALAHSAGQFPRVGRLEAVETDKVDRREGAPAAFS